VRLEQQADGWVVAEAGIAYGGVAAKTIMADAVSHPFMCQCFCLHSAWYGFAA